MNAATLDEIFEAKAALERHILVGIEDFEKKYRVSIANVGLKSISMDTMGEFPSLPKVIGVSVQVVL